MSCSRVLPRATPDGEVVERSHHLVLEPLPRVVAEARAFVAEHAPALPPSGRDALLLLTSELVTNAVIHARTALELGLCVTTGSVVVTVHDLDLAPAARPPDDDREGGWGLGLVRTLSEETAMAHHEPGRGKTAWFRLRRDGGGAGG